MFQIVGGKTKLVPMPVTASTEIAAGTLVTFSSGRLVAATSSTANTDIVGVLKATISSSDEDYADTRDVSVEVPVEKYTEWEVDVTSGLVATDVGLEQDLTDGATVDRSSSSVDAVRCIRVISTTKGIFHVKFSGSY